VTSGPLAGRTVAVTGADGFIGSHVVQQCLGAGAEVRALCMYNSQSSVGCLEDLQAPELDAVDTRFGDIRDPDSVTRFVDGTDVVLHLAALIAIPYSYEAYRSFVDTNATGTLNVLEAVRRHGARMVHTSTSEVYGTPDSVPIGTTHPLKAQSPYSATKIAADKLCEAWACSFGTPVAILRPFNTYGPRQSLRAVIPTLVAQLLKDAGTVRLGSLAPRRDFTFVEDTASAFAAAAAADLAPAEIVQLGSGHAVSIGELVETAGRVLGVTPRVVEDDERLRPADSEVAVLLSDPTSARERLGWSATVLLEEGLWRTAEWIRPLLDRIDTERYHR